MKKNTKKRSNKKPSFEELKYRRHSPVSQEELNKMTDEEKSRLECYWYDLNKWLIEHQPTIKYRFPCPPHLKDWPLDAWSDLLVMSLELNITHEKLAEIFNIQTEIISSFLNKFQHKVNQ
jgi:hypothetical protein